MSRIAKTLEDDFIRVTINGRESLLGGASPKRAWWWRVLGAVVRWVWR